jgi:hypothetical protein
VTENLTPQQILALPIDGPGFLLSKTVGQYLMNTLRKFIRLQDGFDSKRPFGDSDWEDPLVLAFANANLLWLRTDENGLIEDYPSDKFWKIVNDLSDFLHDADFSTLQLPPEPKEWYLVCLDTIKKVSPELDDFDYYAYTEKDARTKADELNENATTQKWIPIHIPPVS